LPELRLWVSDGVAPVRDHPRDHPGRVPQRSAMGLLGERPLAMDVAAGAPIPVAPRARRRRRFRPKDATRSFVFTFVVVAVLSVFLSPIIRSVLLSLRTPAHVGPLDSP